MSQDHHRMLVFYQVRFLYRTSTLCSCFSFIFNVTRYFRTIKPSFLTRYSYAVNVFGTVVVVVVCHGCIIAKRCEIWPRLLLISNRKSHINSEVA